MFIVNEIGSVILQPLAQAIDGLGDLSTLSGEELEALGRLLDHLSSRLEAVRAHLRGDVAEHHAAEEAQDQGQ